MKKVIIFIAVTGTLILLIVTYLNQSKKYEAYEGLYKYPVSIYFQDYLRDSLPSQIDFDVFRSYLTKAKNINAEEFQFYMVEDSTNGELNFYEYGFDQEYDSTNQVYELNDISIIESFFIQGDMLVAFSGIPDLNEIYRNKIHSIPQKDSLNAHAHQFLKELKKRFQRKSISVGWYFEPKIYINAERVNNTWRLNEIFTQELNEQELMNQKNLFDSLESIYSPNVKRIVYPY